MSGSSFDKKAVNAALKKYAKDDDSVDKMSKYMDKSFREMYTGELMMCKQVAKESTKFFHSDMKPTCVVNYLAYVNDSLGLEWSDIVDKYINLGKLKATEKRALTSEAFFWKISFIFKDLYPLLCCQNYPEPRAPTKREREVAAKITANNAADAAAAEAEMVEKAAAEKAAAKKAAAKKAAAEKAAAEKAASDDDEAVQVLTDGAELAEAKAAAETKAAADAKAAEAKAVEANAAAANAAAEAKAAKAKAAKAKAAAEAEAAKKANAVAAAEAPAADKELTNTEAKTLKAKAKESTVSFKDKLAAALAKLERAKAAAKAKAEAAAEAELTAKTEAAEAAELADIQRQIDDIEKNGDASAASGDASASGAASASGSYSGLSTVVIPTKALKTPSKRPRDDEPDGADGGSPSPPKKTARGSTTPGVRDRPLPYHLNDYPTRTDPRTLDWNTDPAWLRGAFP
eukprot:CAMPEP_0119481504 /NCGR_PEP_ID=MMETSP1344-20130328/9811_1 /TAXON_ID=236787 /ORGANISM="Florenciella parvula, Strain CCMP2471" /LENGTH=458 /DNA_ID=CAMNT_0007515881 /DNA_START=410 /DNA_END=1786 /DNA_ORIENTATION=+